MMLRAFRAADNMRSEGPVKTTFTKEDFQRYWRRAKEKTASSILGLHFGHYKAVARSDYLSEGHALLTSIAATTGFSFDHWQNGLTVLLEKKENCVVIEKL